MKAALLVCAFAACVERAPAEPDAAIAGATPVACDGALCATDNGSTCNAAAADPSLLAGVLVALGIVRRRSRR
jgi:hypothetical protein